MSFRKPPIWSKYPAFFLILLLCVTFVSADLFGESKTIILESGGVAGNASVGHSHDQDLNTTNNVTFENVNSTDIHVSDSAHVYQLFGTNHPYDHDKDFVMVRDSLIPYHWEDPWPDLGGIMSVTGFTYSWRNLYLHGNVSNGTSSIHIDDLVALSAGTDTDYQNISYDAGTDTISLDRGGSIDITEVDTNTNADTICAGTDVYLDGEGNCDTLTTGVTTNFENHSARNFVSNACFNFGTDEADGVPGWEWDTPANYDLESATVPAGQLMQITADVDNSSWDGDTNPYLWIEVNTTDWSNISLENNITGRQIRFTGNVDTTNVNLTYDISNYNSSHIQIIMPDGITIPGYVEAPTYNEPINNGEVMEIVDVATRCANAIKLPDGKSIYSNWLTVPNGAPFLVDVEALVTAWDYGASEARIYVQVEAADLNENHILRFSSYGGPSYNNIITEDETPQAGRDYYSNISTEGWRRMQFQLPDLSNPLNWVAASNGLGNYDSASKSSSIKIRVRLLNQYNDYDSYFTGIQLIQGNTEKAFDQHTYSEGDEVLTVQNISAEGTICDSTGCIGEDNNDIFFAYDNAGGTAIQGTTWSPIFWDTEVIEDSSYSHDADSDNITLLNAGRYDIDFQCTADASNTARYTVWWRMEVNDVYQDGSECWSYHRTTTDGEEDCNIRWILDASSNDNISFEAKENSIDGVISTKRDSCRLIIERLS